jgi:hypothetical protein
MCDENERSISWAETVFDYTLCYCDPNYYGHPPHCLDCSSGLDAREGYCPGRGDWSPNPSPTVIMETRMRTGKRFAEVGNHAYNPEPNYCLMEDVVLDPVVACPQRFALRREAATDLNPCSAASVSGGQNCSKYVQCKAGYEGLACSKCSLGFYIGASGQCNKCPTGAARVVFAVGCVGL